MLYLCAVRLQSPGDALVDELTCYFNGDELPGPPDLARHLREEAAHSADRLAHRVGAARLGELAELLRVIRDDPRHQLIPTINSRTLIDWDEPSSWPLFQDFLGQVLS